MPTEILDVQKRGMGSKPALLLVLVFFMTIPVFAAGDVCVVCEKEIRFKVYRREDKLNRTRCFLCGDCQKLPNNCYLCGLPVLKDFTRLPDGRVICKRDAGSVILDDGEAGLICDQVKEALDRQFIRFIAIPTTNVTVQFMDRVRLREIYKIIGNDFSCPNTLGCTETKTKDGRQVFEISLLSGQLRQNLMTTCVHEYAHTWINENVPTARRQELGKDAVEGFCELLSYLFAEQQGLTVAKSNILANHYTRGQIHLFIEAQSRFGLNEIVDWMQYGTDVNLIANELDRVRRVDTPRTLKPAPPAIFTGAREPETGPGTLVLNGIIWSPDRPMAMINHRNFGLNDEAKVPLGNTNVLVRCLMIREDSVTIQLVGTGEKQELRMAVR